MTRTSDIKASHIYGSQSLILPCPDGRAARQQWLFYATSQIGLLDR
ncbi:MAG: hypothetical protein KBS65_06225 [Prevotella sp.]|nr:hypothetical protein [Candidatus Equicola stercoris]